MFLYCVGFRLFRDVCTDIAGGFSAVGRYISDRIEIHFPHNADIIAIHIRNLLKCLISKDTQFFLFEWGSLFFLEGSSTDLSYLTDFWILVFWAPRITRISRIFGFLFFWAPRITRISGSAYLAYRLDFWFCLPFLSSYYLPPGGAGQRTGAAGYERDFFCALVLLVL